MTTKLEEQLFRILSDDFIPMDVEFDVFEKLDDLYNNFMTTLCCVIYKYLMDVKTQKKMTFQNSEIVKCAGQIMCLGDIELFNEFIECPFNVEAFEIDNYLVEGEGVIKFTCDSVGDVTTWNDIKKDWFIGKYCIQDDSWEHLFESFAQ